MRAKACQLLSRSLEDLKARESLQLDILKLFIHSSFVNALQNGSFHLIHPTNFWYSVYIL